MLNNSIRNAMKSYLGEVGREWDYSGITENLEAWERNKKALHVMVSQHPNWDEEEMRFHVDTEYITETNWHDLLSEVFSVVSRCEAYLVHEGGITSAMLGKPIASAVKRVISNNPVDIVTPALKEGLEEVGVSVRVGQKITKALIGGLKKWNYGDNKEYIYGMLERWNELTSEMLGGRKASERWYYSINPVDYLSMSHGNSWSSCHSIRPEDESCHQAGTLSYMNDPYTIVVYRQSKDNRYQKIERGLLWIGKGIISTIERVYPANTNRASAQRIIDGFTRTYGEYRFSFDYFYTDTGRWSHAYEDYEYHPPITRGIYPDYRSGKRLTIGREAYCLKCGDRLDESSSLYCYDCGCGYEMCSDCGNRVTSDEVIWIRGESYCPDCVSLCEDCQEWVSNDTIYEAHRTNSFGSDYTVWVCEHCLGNNYTQCESCGEWHYSTVYDDGEHGIEEGSYCDECYTELTNREDD